MKNKHIFFVLAIVLVVAVTGCKKAKETPVDDSSAGAAAGAPRSMDGINELALGTLKLEGSGDAVTPAQASDLLPLWQMLQGDALQGIAETQAVIKQIEAKMTESQLVAIDAMELTWQDTRGWMEEQGIEMPAQPEGQGGPGGFQNMPEEERTKMREEFQSMSPEQRSTRMAEMGVQRPEGGGQGQGQRGDPDAIATRQAQGGDGRVRGGNFLLNPLVDLLNERAAE